MLQLFTAICWYIAGLTVQYSLRCDRPQLADKLACAGTYLLSAGIVGLGLLIPLSWKQPSDFLLHMELVASTVFALGIGLTGADIQPLIHKLLGATERLDGIQSSGLPSWINSEDNTHA